MRVEWLDRQMSNALSVGTVAMGNECDDIAVATGSLCNRA